MSGEGSPRRRRRWTRRMPRLLLTLYGLLGFAFLYLPIVVLIIFSFNSSAVITFPLQHFTVSWYRELREDFVLLGAVRNSILVTAVTTVGATLVGTAAAFPLVRMGFRMKRTFNLFLLLPIVIPGILTGIALLILFVPVLNLTLSLNTVIAGQIVLAGPFVVLVVASRLYGFNQQLEAAAMDLGATPWRTFWHITFPLILPGVLAGALIAFTLTHLLHHRPGQHAADVHLVAGQVRRDPKAQRAGLDHRRADAWHAAHRELVAPPARRLKMRRAPRYRAPAAGVLDSLMP
ncbi:MAG: ABC transporter permease [Bacillati bacterium ANGP1]|uniref:ABC transporter permease n=1 Tax=Candidatus Segetimicrobium genomatis TaxID=2569760 RepID=A0A537LDV8_9BACT|nr:MAG: ABC transporter permease [Terrabacteria group bacterium ANGP1]